MAFHLAKPAELRDDYEALLDELVPLIAPYLPDAVRDRAMAGARSFGEALGEYADIDQLIGAIRRNGLPTSRDHRVYQLVIDHARTRGGQRDDAA